MADISKIKLGNGNVVNVKDAKAREDLATEVSRLKSAAYKDTVTAITGSDNIPTDEAIKTYVDNLFASIHKFDIVVVDVLPTASEQTMFMLYLIPNGDEGSNSKKEYITIAEERDGVTNYRWELIGTTETSLEGYVLDTRRIAGHDLKQDITEENLVDALGLRLVAHKDKAEVTIQELYGISLDEYTPAGEIVLQPLTQTTTTAAITQKQSYTPTGTITGSAISGGSLDVVLSDTAAIDATVNYKDYTPSGVVSGEVTCEGIVSGKVVPTGNVSTTIQSADTEATLTKSNYTPSGTVSVNLNGNSFNVIDSVGTQASYNHSGFSGGSLGAPTTSQFATAGVVVQIDTTDPKMLVFSNANKANAVTAQGAFTPAVYGTDNFVANTLPTKKAQSVTVGSASFSGAEATDLKIDSVTYKKTTGASSTFTGNSNGDNITATFSGATVDINATFEGDTETNMAVDTVKYKQKQLAKADFIPVAANLSFQGQQAADLIPTEITYDKATNSGATFNGQATTIDVSFDTTEVTYPVSFDVIDM